MFYGRRCPADAPYSAHADELHEWTHHQRKHHERVQAPVKVVDSSPPKCNGMASRAVQEQGRRFCYDQKKAEIGRENRKMVDRLQRIANGLQPPDPRGPPRRADGLAGSPSLPSLSPSQSVGEPIRIGSLNEQFRRKVQRGIENDNVSLVRRILCTRSTFDRVQEEAHFSRHRRTEQLLRRLPGPERKASLAPGRSPGRPALPAFPRDSQALARELQGSLFFLADLRRPDCEPAPLALQHSASAPAVVPGRPAEPPDGPAEEEDVKDDEQEDVREDVKDDVREDVREDVKEDDVREDVQDDVQKAERESVKGDVQEDVKDDVQEDVRKDILVGGQDEGAVPAKHPPGGVALQTWGAENVDGETERRSWLEQDGAGAPDRGAAAAGAEQSTAAGAAPPAAPGAELEDTQASEESDDVPYDDDWDDASMTDGTASMSRTARTRSDGFGLPGGGL